MATETDGNATYIAGVDLGGTKVCAGISTLEGLVVAEDVEATDPRGGLAVIEQIAALLLQLCDAAAIDRTQIACTGVGLPGAVDRLDGTLRLAPNVAGLGTVDLGTGLRQRLGHRVVLDNDANMAVLGEHLQGAGRGHQDLVFISIGTGIGMGILAGGNILTGARGAAGEIAYLPLGPTLSDHAARTQGALELAVSGGALASRFLADTGEQLSARGIVDRAAAGEPQAQEAIAGHAQWIALAIMTVTAILDPNLVVLGGGLGSRSELLGPTTQALADMHALKVPVVTSQLKERAGLIGAIAAAAQAAAVVDTSREAYVRNSNVS